MAKRAKRLRADQEKVPAEPVPLTEAVNRIKAFGDTKFDQSIELVLNLGIDPRQADQAIRGAVSLPHGIGQTRRVIAFCSDDKVEAAKEAGAVEAGGDDLVKKIEDGWMEFDVAVASPDMMRSVARLGRVLGPKGLMPSPKSGTVTPNVVDAVKEYAAGKVEYRNDAGGNVHAVIGKKSFEPKQLEENAQAFIDHILRIKPTSTKGQYVEQVAMSATMSPSVKIALS
ncbi:MAG: 50S ribosomal protein L1 [Phycisphaeraceae bacterium]